LVAELFDGDLVNILVPDGTKDVDQSDAMGRIGVHCGINSGEVDLDSGVSLSRFHLVCFVMVSF
jgi:hypothetical protein